MLFEHYFIFSDSAFAKMKFPAGGQIPVADQTLQSIGSRLPVAADVDDQNNKFELFDDIYLPHGRERKGSTPASFLRMYEQMKETKRQRHSSEESKKTVRNETVSSLKNTKSQSLPPSPNSTPESLRKRLGSLDTQLRSLNKKTSVSEEGSIFSRVTGIFHPPTLQEKNEVDIDFDNENKIESPRSDSPSAAQSLLSWGTQTKVTVSNKDLNMFAPSSS